MLINRKSIKLLFSKLTYLTGGILLFLSLDALSAQESVPESAANSLTYWKDYLYPGLVLLGIAALPPLLYQLNRQIKLLVVLPFIIILIALLGIKALNLLGLAALLFLGILAPLFFYYFVVGGLRFELHFVGTPNNNVVYLAGGAMLANLLGGIGAAIILLPPLIQANRYRRHGGHIPIFFTLIVANLGGLLTPIGAPHLFLFYLFGLPADWFLQFLPLWLFTLGGLLLLFYVYDWTVLSREPIRSDPRDELSNDIHRALQKQEVPQSLLIRTLDYLETPVISLSGKPRLILILTAICVIYLPWDFENAFHWREWSLIALGLISLAMTFALSRKTSFERSEEEKSKRVKLHMAPFVNAAIFYAFVCLILPAVLIPLRDGASALSILPEGLHVVNFSLLSAGVSGLVDGAPTALVLFFQEFMFNSDVEALKQSMPAYQVIYDKVRAIAEGTDLAARQMKAMIYSITAVGALTYSGNIINYYVKKISAREGIPTVGYFRYLAVTLPILGGITALAVLVLIIK